MIINTMTYDDYKKFKNAYNALNLLKKYLSAKKCLKMLNKMCTIAFCVTYRSNFYKDEPQI